MKEEKEHIDKLFQEKLANRSFEVPDVFLADMEAKLDARKHKVGFWRIFTSLLLLGGLIISLWVINSDDYRNDPVTFNTRGLEKKGNSYSESETIGGKKNSKKVKLRAFEKIEYPSFPSDANEQNEINGDNKSRGNSKKDTLISKANQSEIETISSEHIGPNKKNSSNKRSQANSGFKVSISKTAATTQSSTYSSIQAASVQGIIKNKAQIESTTMKMSNNSVSNVPQISKKAVNAAQASAVQKDDTLPKPSRIIRDSVVIRDSLVIRDSVVIKYMDAKKMNQDNPSKLSFEGQFYVGFLQIQPKIITPFASYTSDLEAGEKKVISPNFGFNWNAYYKNWTMGSGLKYYQFGEKTNYSTLKVNSTFDSLVTVVNIIYLDSAGNVIIPSPTTIPFDSITIVTTDSTVTTDSVLTNKSWQNTYSRVVIPLHFGHRFDYKDWSFIPRAGLNFEFTTTRQKGIMWTL